ncbi:aspartate/glutamate racemase family protein [Aquamicrobium lusatiense]|uniref:aspartate/glutamate racemase family protein n=1 Tax=Aquamicrobium lusatiense TaxID=89772 RepID=UPI0024552D6D|nr:aspartate/glutamate racemase family protein [Aquamicrobium lusatiense]MDH4991328.1 aspartate/glutamate racemase family protein [Aquamicrobium lusatiense]
MKTIGLLGGMSWESTAIYYRLLNEGVRSRLGGLHSAKLALVSVDFAEIAELQHAGDWQGAARLLAGAARQLEAAGAQCLVLCTNTMHKLADEIGAATSIPLLHIADAAGAAIRRAGVSRPALLATRFTMEQDFYRQRLAERFGIEAVVPDEAGRAKVHDIIYDELCLGVVKPASKSVYMEEVARLRAEQGADGVIMGCTEITMLIGQPDFDIPVFDTTLIHAEAAIAFALGEA